MKKGFTLIEIIIVIGILGIMASFALPRLTGMQEPARAGEGIQILGALRSAQLRYCLDHPANCSGTNYPAACSTYDLDFPTLKHFNAPSCANDGMLSVDRTNASYRLRITTAGVYECVTTGGVSPCPVASVARIIP